MPVLAATKHALWTGIVARNYGSGVLGKGDFTDVRIDGLDLGLALTGRVVDRPRERWKFYGVYPGEPGLPEWAMIISVPSDNIVVCFACGAPFLKSGPSFGCPELGMWHQQMQQRRTVAAAELVTTRARLWKELHGELPR